MTENSYDSEAQPKDFSPIPQANSLVSECVMLNSRRSWPLDMKTKKVVYVDIPPFDINEDTKKFVRSMVPKAMQVEPSIRTSSRNYNMLDYLGQAGVFQDENGHYYVVTAKHNTACNKKEGTKIKHVDCKFWANSELQKVTVRFDQTGRDISRDLRLPLRNGFYWKYGWDVDVSRIFLDNEGDETCSCWSGLAGYEPEPFYQFDRSKVFQKVPSDYQYQAGERVGILVSTLNVKKTATPKTACTGHVNCTQDELDLIFGKPGGISLYTGVITVVGEDHIEYTINTFKGCSGAIVFLLDGPHRGKAIAIHVGHIVGLDKNIGVKLARGWKPDVGVRVRQLQGIFTLPPVLSEWEQVSESKDVSEVAESKDVMYELKQSSSADTEVSADSD